MAGRKGDGDQTVVVVITWAEQCGAGGDVDLL